MLTNLWLNPTRGSPPMNGSASRRANISGRNGPAGNSWRKPCYSRGRKGPRKGSVTFGGAGGRRGGGEGVRGRGGSGVCKWWLRIPHSGGKNIPTGCPAWKIFSWEKFGDVLGPSVVGKVLDRGLYVYRQYTAHSTIRKYFSFFMLRWQSPMYFNLLF